MTGPLVGTARVFPRAARVAAQARRGRRARGGGAVPRSDRAGRRRARWAAASASLQARRSQDARAGAVRGALAPSSGLRGGCAPCNHPGPGRAGARPSSHVAHTPFPRPHTPSTGGEEGQRGVSGRHAGGVSGARSSAAPTAARASTRARSHPLSGRTPLRPGVCGHARGVRRARVEHGPRGSATQAPAHAHTPGPAAPPVDRGCGGAPSVGRPSSGCRAGRATGAGRRTPC